ncbi:short coiled-coil protein B-like isoform X2 [Mobula hypostoma]|uniref:short coiled-coil protein B-like isoform X2 n=1 Tax=Mobula hypostoma TaxID=723540 RepID=UPI002FC2D098
MDSAWRTILQISRREKIKCVYIRKKYKEKMCSSFGAERDSRSTISDSNIDSELLVMNADMEVIDPESQVELEEKTRLINQVLELQHTLEELSARVDAVKEENLKLKSENQVLGQYIENLMSASSVFQTTDTKGKRK